MAITVRAAAAAGGPAGGAGGRGGGLSGPEEEGGVCLSVCVCVYVCMSDWACVVRCFAPSSLFAISPPSPNSSTKKAARRKAEEEEKEEARRKAAEEGEKVVAELSAWIKAQGLSILTVRMIFNHVSVCGCGCGCVGGCVCCVEVWGCVSVCEYTAFIYLVNNIHLDRRLNPILMCHATD